MSTYRLTARASQVCLAAVLTRHQSQLIPAEFARLTGLTGRSVASALRELESGLALIITQEVIDGQVPLVGEPVLEAQIMHAIQVEALESQGLPEEEPGDTEESDPLGVSDEKLTMVDLVSILSLQGVVDSQLDRGDSGSAGQDVDGMGEVLGQGELDPLEQCQLADEAGDRKAQMVALSAVWAEAFPLPEYKFSQIEPGDSFSKWLTKNGRKAEWVGNIIERVGQRGGHLEHPISYVRAIVEREEGDRAKQTPNNEVGIEITDELRAMVLEGGRRFGNA